MPTPPPPCATDVGDVEPPVVEPPPPPPTNKFVEHRLNEDDPPFSPEVPTPAGQTQLYVPAVVYACCPVTTEVGVGVGVCV